MIARNFTKRKPSNKSYNNSMLPDASADSPVLRSPVAALRWAQLIVIVGAGAFAGYGLVSIGLFLLLAAILAQLIILEYRR